jgi:undecaprenyl-diphosphatase
VDTAAIVDRFSPMVDRTPGRCPYDPCTRGSARQSPGSEEYAAGVERVSTIGVGQAIILGIVEGLTEFLPVSSTGHLKATEGLLGIPVGDHAVIAFTAVIQVGAIAAVFVYFFRDILNFSKAWLRGIANPELRQEWDYRFAWWVIFATVPIVVVGVAAKPLIDGPLASLWVVAGSLVVGSGFMWLAEKLATQKRGEHDMGLADAMLVGSSQILALLFPGFSRSGATISTAMLRGIDRVAATRLSFFLSIPALTGAGIYELRHAVGGGVGVLPLIVGTVVSFVVAYASVAWLLRFVAKHSINGFALYRLVVAGVLFGLLSAGLVQP